jgi:hypothetical protein
MLLCFTPDTMRKIKEMREDVRVERVWTIDGRIRYTIVGNKNILRLPSHYVSITDASVKK